MSDVTHYYVSPDCACTGGLVEWIVGRDTPLRLLGVFRHASDAITQATVLAQHRVIHGGRAQVHVRAHAEGEWRTVWRGGDVAAAYPAPQAMSRAA